jgi:hypothetical protein
VQLRPAYPHDTVTGACFLTGDYGTDEGIIDLDLFVDSMPPYGRLCISPKAVRMLVQVLGYEWPSADVTKELNEMAGLYVQAHEENIKMRKALSHILEAKDLARIENWMVEA